MTGICDIEKLVYFSVFYFRNVTAEEILRQLRENIKTDGKKNVINVDRNNVLGTKESFKREKFMAEHPLFVRFSGEKGIDDGGPSREFMRIIIQAVSESSIFEGESRRKMLLQNLLGNLILIFHF